jgi:hypothetical protein
MTVTYASLRFLFLLLFKYPDEHREDRSLQRVIAAIERLARMEFCKRYQPLAIWLVFFS